MIRKGDFENGDIILITKTCYEPERFEGKFAKVRGEHKHDLGFDLLYGNTGCYLNFDDPREDAVLAPEAIQIMWGTK